MYRNLVIDLTANFTLVFCWEGESNSHVWFTIVGEDPLSGTPVVFAGGPVRGLRECARVAWDALESAKYFSVLSVSTSGRSVVDVWTRDFGANFTRAIKVCGPGKDKVAGVAYTSWARREGARDVSLN